MNFLEKLFSLKSKVIIVTGGSRGIGYSLVKNLSTAGATVIGVGRSKNIKYDFALCMAAKGGGEGGGGGGIQCN